MSKINIGGFNLESTEITKVVSDDRKIKKNTLNFLLIWMFFGFLSIVRTLYEWDVSMLFFSVSFFLIPLFLSPLVERKMCGKFITVFTMSDSIIREHTRLFLCNNNEQYLNYKATLEQLKSYL